MPATAAKLFIPGPTHVRPEILAAQAAPMISHRGPEMKQLLADCLPGVRTSFGTRGDVVILSCSSTAAMEAVGRSVTRPGGRVLHLVNGNFSKLWFELSKSCGLSARLTELPWGEAWDEERTRSELGWHQDLDAVMVTHCETSTGALSDIAGVTRAVRALRPDALVCVDTTSTACGVAIDFDAIDIDIAVGGVQKCWALPPALALGALSERARKRMEAVPARGYTNDFLSALEFQDKNGQTSTTPSIPLMAALRQQIRDIEASGGFQARLDRHLAMQKLVLDWVARHGFGVLAHDGFRSPSVTSIESKGKFVMNDLVAGYAREGFFLTGGYGKTRDTHWRIGHMGDHTPADIAALLDVTDRLLADLMAKPASSSSTPSR